MIRSPLRSPLNPVLSAVGNRRRPTGISPAKLFASGEPGLWYAPRDMATGFQDTAATTPITAVGQFVGRRNDKSWRGNHVLQATATARPTLSARVNLLTKTEDLSHADWPIKNNIGISTPEVAGPAGIVHKLTPTTTNGIHDVEAIRPGRTGGISIKNAGYNFAKFYWAGSFGVINLTTGAITNVNGVAPTAVAEADGWWRLTSVAATEASSTYFAVGVQSVAGVNTFVGDGVSGVYVTAPQLQTGTAATNYQRVNTDTDYDTVGFPLGDKFDGIDDGLATATFAAGTLTSNMDCFVALRRDSDAKVISAYKSAGDSSAYFAAMESAAGTAANAGSGSLTYAVNGVAVAGGTATTRGQLHTAVPVGPWAIIEMRNMDLSSWTSFGFGAYTTFLLNGAIAEIILCPAQSDATRTAIRKYMAKNVGVTL